MDSNRKLQLALAAMTPIQRRRYKLFLKGRTLTQIAEEEKVSVVKGLASQPQQSLQRLLEDGAWAGRRCFIVGGGPSLKGFDFRRLKGELTNHEFHG